MSHEPDPQQTTDTILDRWDYSGLPSVERFNHAVDVANALHREASTLRQECAALREQAIPCHVCGKPASCYGAYEGTAPAFACDACCGHGNEDGRCRPIPEAYAAKEADCAALQAEHAALRERVKALVESWREQASGKPRLDPMAAGVFEQCADELDTALSSQDSSEGDTKREWVAPRCVCGGGDPPRCLGHGVGAPSAAHSLSSSQTEK